MDFIILGYTKCLSPECDDGNKMRDIDDIHEDVYGLVRKRKN